VTPEQVKNGQVHWTPPTKAISTKWMSHPDFGGAYSSLKPGGTPADRDVLGGPIVPGLRFAGEYTSSKYPGTLHGAWFSGEHAANALATDGVGEHVVVVGAGMAGIAAARAMRSAGRQVRVFESGATPGGRAATDRTLGGPVHLGGAWAHGEVGNPIFEIGAELGHQSLLSDWDGVGAFIEGENGIDRSLDELVGGEIARIEKALGEIASSDTEDVALGDDLMRLLSTVDDAKRPMVETYLRTEYENLYATPLDELSLRYRNEDFHLPGDDRMLLGPLDEIVTYALQDIDVRYLHRVTRIESANGKWSVAVCAIDGEETFECDSVIVAIPLTAFQQKRIVFSPPLPDSIHASLQCLNGGSVAKAFFSFNEAFWAPRRAFYAITTQPSTFGLWVDVTPLTGLPTLCAFATGTAALAIETMTSEILCAVATQELARLFGQPNEA
jgi:polyamine oxidase